MDAAARPLAVAAGRRTRYRLHRAVTEIRDSTLIPARYTTGNPAHVTAAIAALGLPDHRTAALARAAAAKAGGVVDPQPPGTLHHIYVITGTLRAGPTDDSVDLAAGDFVRFPGDVPHRLVCLSDRMVAHMVTTLPQVRRFGPTVTRPPHADDRRGRNTVSGPSPAQRR